MLRHAIVSILWALARCLAGARQYTPLAAPLLVFALAWSANVSMHRATSAEADHTAAGLSSLTNVLTAQPAITTDDVTASIIFGMRLIPAWAGNLPAFDFTLPNEIEQP